MRTYLECFPCAVRQAVTAAADLKLGTDVGYRLVQRVLPLISDVDPKQPAPLVGRNVHRMIQQEIADTDPYLSHKLLATQQALDLLPRAERVVADAGDPFHAAVVLSISGNVIDLGTGSGPRANPDQVLGHALTASVDRVAVAELARALQGAASVLVLADNAGEIVLDRPLLDRIGASRVTVVVRSHPIINDATLEDAERSGMVERYRVIANGSDVPGTWLPECSDELRRRFADADVVIAKGQGNYETLSEVDREVFFLLRAKCGPVAEDLGVPLGEFVVRRKPEGRPGLDGP